MLIAHALIARPRLLLLDEPLANLDLRSGQEVVALLARIAREQQVAVLISAHDMNPLLPVMDRIVYLAAGRAASGTTDEVVRTDGAQRLYGHHVDVLPSTAASSSSPARPASSPARADHGPRPHAGRDHLVSAIARGDLRARVLHAARPCRSRSIVGAVVAVVCGAVGVFTVIRGQSFAGEALGDIGTTGGSAAFLVGVGPLWGFVAVAIAAAGVMELIGIQRPRGRDLATGIVLGAGARARRAVPLPRHHRPQHHRRDGHDPVRLAVRDRQLDDPARDRRSALVALGLIARAATGRCC